MSRHVSLGQLKADVIAQGDIDGATTRHPATLITRLINQEIQRFRERVSNEGSQHYLSVTSGTLTVGALPLSGVSFGNIDLAEIETGVVRVYGVDITVNGVVKSLSHVPFNERDQYGGPEATGEPVAWANWRTNQIAIWPPPQQAYPYQVWYLPVREDLVSDDDSIDMVAGWEDAIVWGTVCRLLVRDNYPQAYGMAVQFRDEIMRDILRGATKVTQAGGAHVGQDTFGARMGGIRRSRRLPPP